MKEESVLAGSMDDEKGLSRWVGVDWVNRMEHTQGMPNRDVPKPRCGGVVNLMSSGSGDSALGGWEWQRPESAASPGGKA